jgi:hypothetical protein
MRAADMNDTIAHLRPDHADDERMGGAGFYERIQHGRRSSLVVSR